MKEALLRTFEMRRARWLQMSALLHTVHSASTHTRLSHQIGSMIVGVNALREMDVYPRGDMQMLLGEYLLLRGNLHEFLLANFLHDIGHSPLSHVMEPNPFIKLDHEEITRNLILGVKPDEEKGMDWYVAERYLLKTKAIKNFEYRFFENRYDSVYDLCEGEEGYLFSWNDILENDDKRLIGFLKKRIDIEWLDNAIIEKIDDGKTIKLSFGDNSIYLKLNDDEINVILKIGGIRTDEFIAKTEKDKLNIYEKGNPRDTKFLDCLTNNDEILESEIIAITEVLDNFGVDKKLLDKILTGNDKSIQDTQFLNKLIHSEIDFDRIDHVKRDSVVCGLSLSSFRLLELLGSMSVVLPYSDVHEMIYNRDINKPYILISEDGVRYIMDLLIARRSVFNDILYSDENNWINGVVNQITAQVMKYLPHLEIMLPFITDQILMQFYTNDLFLGTQIEKLNKLFHGKIDCSGYGKPMRYKLKDEETLTNEQLKKMYKAIKEINDEHNRIDTIAVVFYTNIEGKEEKGEYLFSWDEIPGNDNGKLIEFLKQKFEIDLLKTAEIEKINNGNTIKVTTKINHLSLNLNQEKTEVIFTIDYDWTDKFMAKMENGKLNIYKGEKAKEKEWDDVLIYKRKFYKHDSLKNGKYHPFKELAEQKSEEITPHERFPNRPSELAVKNLFYFWIYDFVLSENDKHQITDTAKNELINKIKIKIGAICSNDDKIDGFKKTFVALDEIKEVNK